MKILFPGTHSWSSKRLTQDHKPESKNERLRINNSGGKVMSKRGVQRVVWNRPKIEHRGPVRRSTHIDEIPFLSVARSLGDLWSYNSELNEFVVSPEPDCKIIDIDDSFRCLIFGTDGLWNMFSPNEAVEIVNLAEKANEKSEDKWINPSIGLMEICLQKWDRTNYRADNISIITILLNPPKYEMLEKSEIGFNGFCSFNGLKNIKKDFSGSNLSVTITDQCAKLLDHSTNELFILDENFSKDVKTLSEREPDVNNKTTDDVREDVAINLSHLYNTKSTEKNIRTKLQTCHDNNQMSITKEFQRALDPECNKMLIQEKENCKHILPYEINESIQLQDTRRRATKRTMLTRRMTKVDCSSRVTRSNLSKTTKNIISNSLKRIGKK